MAFNNYRDELELALQQSKSRRAKRPPPFLQFVQNRGGLQQGTEDGEYITVYEVKALQRTAEADKFSVYYRGYSKKESTVEPVEHLYCDRLLEKLDED
jgi:hypothetical protein